jgi:putative ATP-binding cassette transporter
VSGDHQNPEYRIADDVRIATESPVDLVAGVTTALLSAATFIVILWTIGGALDFAIGAFRVYVPGFLVIAAAMYALVASGSMILIGRRFAAVSLRIGFCRKFSTGYRHPRAFPFAAAITS